VSESPQARRQMVIEIGPKTSVALERRKEREGLNESTLFNRAMQVYDLVMQSQEAEGQLVLFGREVIFE
jgi:hypothetical protein